MYEKHMQKPKCLQLLTSMDAAHPDVALRPSKAQLERRQAWQAFVRSAVTIYEVCLICLVLVLVVSPGH